MIITRQELQGHACRNISGGGGNQNSRQFEAEYTAFLMQRFGVVLNESREFILLFEGE